MKAAILFAVLLALGLVCSAAAAAVNKEKVNSPYFQEHIPYNSAYGCNDGTCKDGALCYPQGVTWTDSTRGKCSFSCEKSYHNGEYVVVAKGC
ncbi:hypothetical protein ONE63_001752 [Megalurothrips usitatus]|uniref:Uncharacterized protein n=1 Tax=Megalurothrips usitatus TaxID=439358 RepID=A0AAV7XDA7_9NEOP|nr:hypothetical protein ONE63_001752 [Megalurothrips usitatus]